MAALAGLILGFAVGLTQNLPDEPVVITLLVGFVIFIIAIILVSKEIVPRHSWKEKIILCYVGLFAGFFIGLIIGYLTAAQSD
jgi:hypothetical protein